MIPTAGSSWALGLATLALGAACAAPPPPAPLAPPPLAAAVQHFPGTVLEGPQPRARTAAAAAGAHPVQCAVWYLEDVPTGVLQPLGRHSELIAALRDPTPIQATSAPGLGVRTGSGDAATALRTAIENGERGRWVEVTTLTGVLPPDVTVEFAFGADSGGAASADPDAHPPRLAVALTRNDGQPPLSVAVSLYGLPVPEARATSPDAAGVDGDDAEWAIADPQPALMLLGDQPAIGGAPLALLAPAALAGQPAGALAMFVTVGAVPPLSDEGHAARVAACWAEIEELRREVAARATTLAPDEAIDQAWATAWRALATAPERRQAALWLAQTAGAPLATDVALLGTTEQLEQMVAPLRELATRPAFHDHRAQAAWLLERAAYRLASATRPADSTVDELRGALLRHAGVAGQDIELLREGLAASRDAAMFAGWLRSQNADALTDTNPASRVRAFDWLAVRGWAPAGYDPLADRDTRRRALAAARAAEAAAEAKIETETKAETAKGTTPR